MAKLYPFVLLSLVLTLTPVTSKGQTSDGPETVVVHNGPVTLHAMVWRPHGSGPFPAILLNHGSGRSREQLEHLGPYERNAETLGPVSPATAMYSSTCSGMELGLPRIRALTPSI